MPDILTISRASPISTDTIIESLRKDLTLPTTLLYDEKGLKLFEKITYNPHYYLTECEIDILKAHASEIASNIADSTIIELGSGALRKTSLILQALENLGIQTDYYALDLDRSELERSLSALEGSTPFKHVKLHGLHADYNDIHDFLARHTRRVAILWMGSSVGNFDRHEAAEFILSLKKSLKVGDSLLIGIDHRNDAEKIQTAYNDPDGDSEAFELNALVHAGRILGKSIFNLDEWNYQGIYDDRAGRHEACFVPLVDVKIDASLTIPKGTKVRIERSYKYSNEEVLTLFDRSELHQTTSWTDKQGLYSIYLANVPSAYIPSRPGSFKPVPSLEEWHELWKIWDTITLDMIPTEMLHTKPIDLRNPCIFYIGHIPTFLDIHLSRVGNGKYTNSAYTQIFERGIDPDVDDPTQCHSHSEIPDTWPDLEEMLEFRDKVRDRLTKVYTSGQIEHRNVARAVFTVYEHEAMHAETLLYMLIQSESTLPPTDIVQRPFPQNIKEIKEATWLNIPEATIEIGMDDIEGSDEGSFFGWDNEKPRREVNIKAFSIQSRPVTNGEYAKFLSKTTEPGRKWRHPKSWTPDMRVRTVFGSVAMAQAVNWPVAASYDELEKYARWSQARLPTFEELRHFIDTSTGSTKTPEAPFNNVLGKCVNFSQWTPAELRETPEPQVYTGVWEWTSTQFDRTPGFVTSKIYPGYSEDFFDKKHNIVLGGSWATISRIAARRSFVNWYQRNYEYAWAGCRLVRDL